MSKAICQSCGMPLYKPEMLGTDSAGLLIEDYCLYCFKDGQFTSDVTMNEMINLCAKYVENDRRIEVVEGMKVQYPTLKRWARKEATQNEYHKSINNVLDYINEHLNENPDLDRLSQIANISPYHFHRIFKGIIGENLGEYVQRLRLEFVALQLRTANYTLDVLADKTGYNSKQALSKAFKKHFGLPPSIYKITPGKWAAFDPMQLTPRICNIKQKNILYIRIVDKYGNIESYSNAWEELYTFAILCKVYNDASESIGISFDDPTVTNEGKCRFYACVTIDKRIAPVGKFGCRTIKGGLYAVFTYKGSYKGLHNLYKNICFHWLPASTYRFREGVSFEKYLNNPNKVAEKDILTEIYIPISPKREKPL